MADGCRDCADLVPRTAAVRIERTAGHLRQHLSEESDTPPGFRRAARRHATTTAHRLDADRSRCALDNRRARLLPRSGVPFPRRSGYPSRAGYRPRRRLVKYDRLAIALAPLVDQLGAHVEVRALDAAMRHPGSIEIIEVEAVVYGAQMPIGVATADQLCDALPIGERFVLHQIIFVGKRPPNVAEGSKACRYIAQVQLIRFARHTGKAPAIIR